MEDASGYKEFLRKNVQQYNRLVDMVSQLIFRRDTYMKEAISLGERVALTLRFLATGESFHSLGFQFRVSWQAILYIVEETSDAILQVLGA